VNFEPRPRETGIEHGSLTVEANQIDDESDVHVTDVGVEFAFPAECRSASVRDDLLVTAMSLSSCSTSQCCTPGRHDANAGENAFE
jgi:hypothetical protein